MTEAKALEQAAERKGPFSAPTVHVTGAVLRPDLRFSVSGLPVLYLTLAGEVREGDRSAAYYLDARVLGERAIALSEALREGDPVAVQGVLSQHRREGAPERTGILARRVYRTEGQVGEAGRLLDGLNLLSGYARVVGEPRRQVLESGLAVASVRVLLRGDKEEAVFLTLEGWEELSERVASLRKGDGVLLEARLQSTSWTDQAGVRRYGAKLVARRLAVVRRALEEAGGSNALPDIDDGLFLEEEDLPF